jgi:hypothetical protein
MNLKVFPIKHYILNIVFEFLFRTIKQEKEKGIQIRNKEVESTLFSDEMIMYLKYP